MKTLTVKELESKLREMKGTTFATIVAFTPPDFVGGKSCPMIQRGVRKLAVVNVLIGGWSYENSVNNRRLKEASEDETVEYFYPEKRRWGVRLHDKLTNRLLGLVEHDKEDGKKYYLETKVERSIRHNYYDKDGKHVSKAEAEKYLRPKKEGARQEVEKPVIVRDYTLENIKAIRLNGEVFAVVA